MIKCNRCGQMNTAGMVNCQQCGAALSGKIEGMAVPRMGGQEQPELPAWLGSLRAGERPGGPTSNTANNFTAADLIEEGNLPSWMRPERSEAEANLTGPQGTVPPPMFPTSEMGGTAPPTKGIAAHSLIDEQSLPSWMQEGRLSTTPPPMGGLPASNLLQQDSMPDWMKSLQQRSPAPGSDMQVQPVRPPAQPLPPAYPSSSSVSQGFSAKDLIDPQALPPWMSQQSDQPAQQNSQPSTGPTSGFYSGGGQAGQNGLPASSLLDADSLPPWLRESRQNQPGNASPPAANRPGMPPTRPEPSWQPPPASGNQSWPNIPSAGGQPMQTPAMNPPQGAAMPASSFIDVNSLPDWLRSAADQHPGPSNAQSGPIADARSMAPPVPPRVDNMRVPSRPRSEMSSTESSEMAATVFASMLGVASVSPQYPGQTPNPSYPQPGQPGATQSAGMNMAPGPGYMPSPPGISGIASANSPQQGYPQQNPGGYSGMAYPQNYPMGAPPVEHQQGSASHMAGMTSPAQIAEQRANARPTKRRFLDAIREWFER